MPVPPLTDHEILNLRDIMLHAQVRRTQGISELKLKNVEMWTDIGGQAVVSVIDTSGTSGVQRPIGVRGASKCIICDEYDRVGLVCTNCHDMILLLRRTIRPKDVANTVALLEKLNDEGLIDAIKMVHRENIKEWMDNQIEGMK